MSFKKGETRPAIKQTVVKITDDCDVNQALHCDHQQLPKETVAREPLPKRRVDYTKLRSFLTQHLEEVEHFAKLHRIAEKSNYSRSYRRAKIALERLNDKTFDELTMAFRLLDNGVEKSFLAAIHDEKNLPQIAKNLLGTYEVAQEDPILSRAYQALRAAYHLPRPVHKLEWIHLIQSFYARLADFRATTRQYLFDLVTTVSEQIERYSAQVGPTAANFLQQMTIMIKIATTPAEYLAAIGLLENAEGQVAEAMISSASLSEIKTYLSDTLRHLEGALSQGIEMSPETYQTLRACQNDFYHSDNSRSVYCRLIKQLNTAMMK
jgi:hypothetical protein